MKKIYSLVKPELLLHILNRKEDIQGRTDLIEADQFLQCATLNMNKGTTFRPHEHLKKDRHFPEMVAQESWIVVSGSVRCTFYDITGLVIEEDVLEAGDASFTLYGGHNYEALEDNTLVYEYKTGPYEGQILDKRFLMEECK